MKITGPKGTGPAAGPQAARPAGRGGFKLPSLAEAAGPARPGAVAGVTGMMGVDALLALQNIGGPLERKRRAVRRAGRMLDVLEEVKLALLEGNLSGHQLERLQRAVREERGATDDPTLEALLDDIELRAAVEIAKLEKAGRAA